MAVDVGKGRKESISEILIETHATMKPENQSIRVAFETALYDNAGNVDLTFHPMHSRMVRRRVADIANTTVTIFDPVTKNKVNLSGAGVGEAIKALCYQFRQEDIAAENAARIKAEADARAEVERQAKAKAQADADAKKAATPQPAAQP